ncbi:MAG: DUF234 domain-containing protein [Planctomycetota bacterium]
MGIRGSDRYPDWRGLLTRIGREARQKEWRGPIIFDEFPYLVQASPELPSVLQRWLDHEAREARLVVAVAGSSQRMMQGFVLSKDAPLYGRAREILEIRPLPAACLTEAFPGLTVSELVQTHASWGGVPRYWELAVEESGSPRERVESLILDPLGPLHREPDHILIEEIPSALEVRPVLDAIGSGVHRVSEIAGRLGRPATSLSRPLDRLLGMGLIKRELPFGESERSRRSLYRMNDPFFRLWFRVVAPHRAYLASNDRRARRLLLDRYWGDLVAESWEELCRTTLPSLGLTTRLGQAGPWGAASRWWGGAESEWDVVAESLSGDRLLLGEARWSARPFTKSGVESESRRLASKTQPPLGHRLAGHEILRALFIPAVQGPVPKQVNGIHIVTAAELLKKRENP